MVVAQEPYEFLKNEIHFLESGLKCNMNLDLLLHWIHVTVLSLLQPKTSFKSNESLLTRLSS